MGELSPTVNGVYVPFGEFRRARYIPHMVGIDRDRLRGLLAEKGLTPRKASLLVSDNAYLVRDILSGKSQNPRSDTVSKLAGVLGVPTTHLLIDEFPNEEKVRELTATVKLHFLPVRYEVQAGHWREVDSAAQAFIGQQPVAPNPRFSRWPQWLELVRGDSIDKHIAEGGYAHVVDAIAMGYAPRHDDLVVVERRRFGGQLRERTIKQVSLTANGTVELWPRSTNEHWNEPLKLAPEDAAGSDIEVEIVGLVIGAYIPLS